VVSSLTELRASQHMKTRNYSDDEIHHLIRQVLTEQPSDPRPALMRRPQSNSGAGVQHELSFDEILKKIQDEIAEDR
jgi:hypothetical protein